MAENKDFDLDLDAILSEFTSVPAAPAPVLPSESEEPDPLKEKTAVFEPVTDAPAKKAKKPEKAPAPVPDEAPKKKKARRAEAPKREEKEEKPAPEKKQPKKPLKEPKPPKEKKPKREHIPLADRLPRGLVKTVSILLVMAMLAFVLDVVNPSAGSAASTRSSSRSADIASSVNAYATELTRDAALRAATELSEIVPEEILPASKTVYKIAEDAVVAPEALAMNFGKVPVSEASEILPVIEQARAYGLLGEDETVAFDPNAEFNTGSYYQDIQYYLDETLLVIAWKEIIDGNTCTFCEVKMQDGSQFRRKLAGDTFGSDILEYTTTMHEETNAVVSMNADYYRFRDMGIVVYNRELYRFNEGEYLLRYGQMLRKYNCIDTLFVTSNGDFLFWHLYDETTPEAMQQFIDENDILFSIAFGPILVENGELNTSYFEEEWYPIGEINTGYSRAGIGQLGEHHYLYMSLNHSDEKSARWKMEEFAQHFYEKGVINAYALDGGQTSEIVFQGGEAYNHVDHVNGTSSRQVSDMIYFASAINGEEVTQ